jgi:hypothetical protein
MTALHEQYRPQTWGDVAGQDAGFAASWPTAGEAVAMHADPASAPNISAEPLPTQVTLN